MHLSAMDEVDAEDVTVGNRGEDVRARGKEIENVVESCNVRESRGRVSFREGDFSRSSIQQFVDILGGKDQSSVVNIVETSQNPSSRFCEGGEGRVRELTLGEYRMDFGMMNEREVMDTILNEWQHGNQAELGAETNASNEHSMHMDKSLLKADAGQLLNHNPNLRPGQSTNDESEDVLQHALSSGAMRMKIISRSSECPEYFIKSTLKGKGVLCKGPISGAAEAKGQSIVKAAVAPTDAYSPINMRQSSVCPSNRGDAASVGGESLNNEMNLRDWMKSRQIELQKVDPLYIFKLVLDLVYSFHSDGKVLVDLRPTCFRLLPSGMIEYFGRLCTQNEIRGSIMLNDVPKSQALKRPLEQGMSPHSYMGTKHQKSVDNTNILKMKSQFQLGYGPKIVTNEFDANLSSQGVPKTSSMFHVPPSAQQHTNSVNEQLEEKWYRSPEELFGRDCTFSSNIYSLGVLFFELLSNFDSGKVQATAMSDLRYRILSPTFLSENPKEAGFCLWLLHPEPSLRPTTRDVLQSEVVSELQALFGDSKSSSINSKSSSIKEDEGETELLLHFLSTMKEQKQKYASKLVEDLGCIESDIKELEKRHLLKKSMTLVSPAENYLYARQKGFLYHGDGVSAPISDGGDSRFLKNGSQLESAYFSARSQIHIPMNNSVICTDRDMLKNRENGNSDQNDEDDQGAFFDGLCKYARYSKLKLCGTLRNRDITNSTNVVCSLSFDRDEDYFAAAGVSKKIKIFDFHALYDNSVDIHYPAIEMSNKSKLSCVCWNNYIRNYLASTDYDGIVKLWDASTGQEFSQYTEHIKRAWSVDFSLMDPMKLASGSDDCSVKLWSINERNCLNTIRTIANVCCVQFSAHSSHLLALGSADYKIYCYDLRNADVPWCVLDGHEKAVSYVKFIDSGTLVSASTDNTLKLWDLSRSSPTSLPNNACKLTLGGHKNEKNFVGLAVADGYIACGSETNEVYSYYKSLPMPITSHKFGSVDPISGKETDDGNGQFVSSVCWKGNSNVIVAANSSGCIKVLEMV